MNRTGTFIPRCPICGQPNTCKHFVGWTDDGLKIEPRIGKPRILDNVLPTDIIVNTGVTARVYRGAKPEPVAFDLPETRPTKRAGFPCANVGEKS